jgi:hypothetical protein
VTEPDPSDDPNASDAPTTDVALELGGRLISVSRDDLAVLLQALYRFAPGEPIVSRVREAARTDVSELVVEPPDEAPLRDTLTSLGEEEPGSVPSGLLELHFDLLVRSEPDS